MDTIDTIEPTSDSSFGEDLAKTLVTHALGGVVTALGSLAVAITVKKIVAYRARKVAETALTAATPS